MKKILLVFNVDSLFVSHFLNIGLEGLKNGHEVYILCGVTKYESYIKSLGFNLHKLNISRSGKNIFKELYTILNIYNEIKEIKPDIIEFYTIKPVIYGGITSKFLNIEKKIFYITGLGYVFMKKSTKNYFLKLLVNLLYKIALYGKNNFVITENSSDKNFILETKMIPSNKIRIIGGAGVDLLKYNYIEENNNKLVVTMASRLLKDKGVFEYVEAAKLLKIKYKYVEFFLYGDLDFGNPSSLTKQQLEEIKSHNFINVKGFSSDVSSIFSSSNIVVLPSYREGFPKVLMEASACGRAIVTTNVPGCIDAVKNNVNGLICEVKNVSSLADKLEKLIVDEKLRNTLGKQGRKYAKENFDLKLITKKHFELYDLS